MGKTSAPVKNRYKNKVYTTVRADLKKELVARFEQKLVERGDTKAGVIRKAIESYIEEV